mgnify:FL=1
MDAWIEIIPATAFASDAKVASFMDAWIEIRMMMNSEPIIMVASFMDAWIEIPYKAYVKLAIERRILYGCVD